MNKFSNRENIENLELDTFEQMNYLFIVNSSLDRLRIVVVEDEKPETLKIEEMLREIEQTLGVRLTPIFYATLLEMLQGEYYQEQSPNDTAIIDGKFPRIPNGDSVGGLCKQAIESLINDFKMKMDHIILNTSIGEKSRKKYAFPPELSIVPKDIEILKEKMTKKLKEILSQNK